MQQMTKTVPKKKMENLFKRIYKYIIGLKTLWQIWKVLSKVVCSRERVNGRHMYIKKWYPVNR